ncbi:MAG: hypothetical protein LBN05_06640 [Oscillospiraceae bacterium]|jgi:hypothetical protein|nr:hypothetical protein [Oscillospiraceae bacterium]
MVDTKTLAYINLFAVLGTIENLCEIVPEATELAQTRKPIAIGFDVKDGPAATLTFAEGKVRLDQGILGKTNAVMRFSSPEKFNAMIDGANPPINLGVALNAGFLTKQFTELTKVLESYMRPEPEKLADKKFFEQSTTLMFYTIATALSQIANNDEIGKFSAAHTPDGEIGFNIVNGPSATLRVKDGRFLTIKKKSENPRAVMEFESIELARDLFDNKVNALGCIGTGRIAMTGMISMLDNLNRLLDRVALYLA